MRAAQVCLDRGKELLGLQSDPSSAYTFSPVPSALPAYCLHPSTQEVPRSFQAYRAPKMLIADVVSMLAGTETCRVRELHLILTEVGITESSGLTEVHLQLSKDL